MAEGDAAHDLAEDVAHLLLAEARLRVEHVEQVAAVDVLHDHHDLRLRVQHLVQPDHVRVVEQLEQPDLLGEAARLRRHHDAAPVEALDREQLAVRYSLRELDLAERAAAESLPYPILVRAPRVRCRPAAHAQSPEVVRGRVRGHRVAERHEEVVDAVIGRHDAHEGGLGPRAQLQLERSERRRRVGGGPKGLHIKQVDDPLVRLAALAEELQLLSVEDKVPSLHVGRTGRPLLRFGPLSQVQPRDSPTHHSPFGSP
mmetsp:Transcript_35161/g.89233  ORF Transcript_35161/g.89233 Transcript_35161/m.89233 type:complete len:257 (-) Transcript_35161:8-778(-)